MSSQLNIRMTQDRVDALNSFMELYQTVEKKELYENSKALFEAVRLAKRYLRLKERKRHIIKKQFQEDFSEEI